MHRFKVILNVDVEEPYKPFPAGGDYTHLNYIQGIAHLLSNTFYGWRLNARCTIDKIVERPGKTLVEEESELFQLMGHPVYTRLDWRDPDVAAYTLDEMKTAIKDVFRRAYHIEKDTTDGKLD